MCVWTVFPSRDQITDTLATAVTSGPNTTTPSALILADDVVSQNKDTKNIPSTEERTHAYWLRILPLISISIFHLPSLSVFKIFWAAVRMAWMLMSTLWFKIHNDHLISGSNQGGASGDSPNATVETKHDLIFNWKAHLKYNRHKEVEGVRLMKRVTDQETNLWKCCMEFVVTSP
jgi:hypothetical protein